MAEAKKPQDRKPKSDAPATVKVDGITLTVSRDELAERLSDWDVVEGIGVLNDGEALSKDRLVAASRVMRAIFASEYDRVKRELRAKNDGKLTESIMTSFMTDTFKEFAPKS